MVFKTKINVSNAEVGKNMFPRFNLIFFTCILFIIAGQLYVNAQDEACAFTLREAEKLYQQGNIETIPTLLSDCIEEGFTDEERLDAYKLIIMSFLFDDKLYKADSAMLTFLKIYPEYDLSPTDFKRFANLFNTYSHEPVFHFGVVAGLNLSSNFIKENLDPVDLNKTVPDYSMVTGFQIGMRFKFNLSKHYNLLTDLYFMQNGYEKTLDSYIIEKVSTAIYSENRVNLYLPISVSYQINTSNEYLKPYIKSGLGVSYMTKINGLATDEYTNGIDGSTGTLDLADLYNPLNVLVNIGGGITFKFLRGNLFLETSYHQSLLNQRNNDTESDLFYQMAINPDKLRQGVFQFSLGYIYSVYKPIKLR